MTNRVVYKLLGAAVFIFSCRYALAEPIMIDDFSDNTQSEWVFVSDQVMGGVSTGRISFKVMSGYSYVEMSGQVSTKNNGGFIQFRRKILDFDLQGKTGIVLTVRGNGQRYFIHLRNQWTMLPWQYYQAGFDVTESWQEVRLPLTSFKSSSKWLPKVLNGKSLSSVGIVAFGRDHIAQIDLKEIGFY